tara:strand:- start:208 stop:525 length:318 start_codon:yes stop_codon:yes gene_type:complete
MQKLNYDKATLFEDLRYDRRLTGKDMAEKLNITPGTYSYLERGDTWPSFGTILKTLEVFPDVTFEGFAKYYEEREDYITRTFVGQSGRTRRQKARAARELQRESS